MLPPPPASINAVGTVNLGLQYCLGLLSVFVVRTYPSRVRPIMILCLGASVSALFASSFATKVRNQTSNTYINAHTLTIL